MQGAGVHFVYAAQPGSERGTPTGASVGGMPGMWMHPSYLNAQMRAQTKAGTSAMSPIHALPHQATGQVASTQVPPDPQTMYRDYARRAQATSKSTAYGGGRGSGRGRGAAAARAQLQTTGQHVKMHQPPVPQKPSRPVYNRDKVLAENTDEATGKRKPNKTISADLASMAPEASFLKQLIAFENDLDEKTGEVLRSIDSVAGRAGGVPHLVRVTVCNTHSPAAEGGGPQAHHPVWTLHINATVVDERGVSTHKLNISDVLHKVLVRPHQREQADVLDKPEFSWQRGPGCAMGTGFQLTQSGPNCNTELELDVFLWFRHSPDRLTTRNKELQNLLGVTTDIKSGWTRALWSYVKRKRLHDPTDIKFINLDADLARLVGTHRCELTTLPGLLFSRLEPALPLNIRYRLDLTSKHVKPKVVDTVLCLSPERAAPSSFSRELEALDIVIGSVLDKAKIAKTKRDFMQAAAESPKAFLEQLFASHEKDVQEMKRLLYGKTHIKLALMPEERTQSTWALDWVDGVLERYQAEVSKRGTAKRKAAEMTGRGSQSAQAHKRAATAGAGKADAAERERRGADEQLRQQREQQAWGHVQAQADHRYQHQPSPAQGWADGPAASRRQRGGGSQEQQQPTVGGQYGSGAQHLAETSQYAQARQRLERLDGPAGLSAQAQQYCQQQQQHAAMSAASFQRIGSGTSAGAERSPSYQSSPRPSSAEMRGAGGELWGSVHGSPAQYGQFHSPQHAHRPQGFPGVSPQTYAGNTHAHSQAGTGGSAAQTSLVNRLAQLQGAGSRHGGQ